MRGFLMVSAAVAITVIVLAAQRVVANSRAEHERARVAAADSVPVPMFAPGGELIAAEAQVFRTRPGVLAIEPVSGPRRAAHPRTLATFRVLRVYPGAPPRIPHGLTPVEYQTSACTTCHERGGYSQRFGAYVPVTPHPEMGACLQCHVGDATLMAISLPNTDPSARCLQCHSSGGARWRDSSLNWTSLAWPVLTQNVHGRSPPPPIPHDLQMRGNCLACHSGPAGVAEIQTPHPERANCRQCHVAGGASADAFVRPGSLVSAREDLS
jgi:cytochrome c-type protein NapB